MLYRHGIVDFGGVHVVYGKRMHICRHRQLAGQFRYGDVGKTRALFEKFKFKAVLQILWNRFHRADVFGQLQKVLFA